jgi:Domain of unknown function (DUF1707)
MLLVSDKEREYTVGLLRRHWLTGRLTADEFEQRVGEAWQARFAQDLWHSLRWLPPEPPVAPPPVVARGGGGAAVASFVLAILALCLLFFSLGLAFPIALPMFVTAWALGRDSRRNGSATAGGLAAAGEVLGVVGTTLCLLFLASCAYVLT